MAARESSDVTHDDITTDRDLFWAAVKEEVDLKPSSQPAYTAVSVKVEPVDSDEVLTSDDGQTGKADTLLPPIEEVNVDPPPVKTEPKQEDPWGHLEVDVLSQLDPLLLPVDVKQEAKKEMPSPGSILTSPCIKEESDTDGAEWQLKSESYESDFLTSVDPLLLPGKQEEEEGRVSLPCIAAGKEEVVEEKSFAEPFTCNICKGEFARNSSLKRHILRHSDCKRQSTNLRCHTKTHTGDKLHVCSVCSKRFKQSCVLKRHMLHHTGEKPHACSVCGKRFTQLCNLKRHVLHHSGEKPHSCSVCSKSFTQSSTLKQHMFSHTGGKPLSCSVCNKGFTLRSHLKLHMFTHTGEKPLSCSVCNKRFTTSGQLKQHMFSHTGEKPLACSVCSKRFAQCGHLKQHMVSHTPTTDKAFTCSVCSLHFAYGKTLKRHMQAQHPDQ